MFWIGVLNQRFKTLILPSQNKHERSLSDIITAHNMKCMIYADDIQLYIDFEPSDRPSAIERLELCIADIKSWAIANKLKFNDSKTE